ncbi:jg15985 [Pararge aegeria aegeria]|uniref:Jg15985 protein n=1 Tax=Pararge aegeria aegeria TaxID=348720 RepID=A0A8S4SIR6_9NEOP|nr:jg15985 [Pararge aegeria aegeria]
MGGEHSSENRWTQGFQGARMTTNVRTGSYLSAAALIGLHRGGQTMSTSRWEPLGKRGHGTWFVEHPTKDLCPAASRRQSVEVMMTFKVCIKRKFIQKSYYSIKDYVIDKKAWA